MCNHRKRSTRLRARRNRHTFTSLRCRNGNVSCRRSCLHHHANRQMVERRLFAIYSQAGRTILERRFAENDNTSIVPNDPCHCTSSCVKRRSPTAQPSRQCRDLGEILDAMRLDGCNYRLSLFSTNQPTTQKQLMEEASSFRSLKGVGRGES